MGEPRIGPDGTSGESMCIIGNVLDIMSAMNRVIKINGQELLLSLVSIGNPHAVHFYNGLIADFPIAKLGLKVEQHKLFPDETNFEVVRIINRKQVEALVWERGVGETLPAAAALALSL